MTMPAATPKFLKHKKSGRVYPYHPELAKLGDEVEPFDFTPTPKPTPVAPKATPPVAAAPAVDAAKPDPMAKARAARAAKAAQKKAAVGQPDDPIDQPAAPLTINPDDVDAALGRITDRFEDETGE